jgi:hypothetical protein
VLGMRGDDVWSEAGTVACTRTGRVVVTHRAASSRGERLGVSRNTPKQATVALEVQGLVEIRHGRGTYLGCDSLAAEPIATIATRRTDDDLDEMDAAIEARRSARVGSYSAEAQAADALTQSPRMVSRAGPGPVLAHSR